LTLFRWFYSFHLNRSLKHRRTKILDTIYILFNAGFIIILPLISITSLEVCLFYQFYSYRCFASFTEVLHFYACFLYGCIKPHKNHRLFHSPQYKQIIFEFNHFFDDEFYLRTCFTSFKYSFNL